MASQISQAIKQICDEKNISYESVIETIESALAAAYRKDFGNKNQNIQAEFDPEKYDGAAAGIRVFDVKTVVEDMELVPENEEQTLAAKEESESIRSIANEYRWRGIPRPPRPGEPVPEETESEEPKFNPKTMIMIRDARDIKPDARLEEEIRVELSIPAAFGRMAAQTAKQVIMQKIREAERNVIFEDFKGREGELMNVTVQRREGRMVLIDLGRATGILLPEDQIENERYYPGTRLKALLREVVMTPKGPEIRLSRSSPELVSALFAQEIPEVANGIVMIKSIAREPGSRTKVSVATNDDAIDPIGSCIGQRGTRIQAVIRELGGEKVDVIAWTEDIEGYVAAALSPAAVQHVEILSDEHLAVVSVAADQLSLAIGKGGQNVRLAAKLTSWKITIKGEEGVIVADSETGEIKESPSAEATGDANADASEDNNADADVGATHASPEAESVVPDAVAEEVAAPKKTRKKKEKKEEKKEDAPVASEGDATVLDEGADKAERADEADANTTVSQ
ncbi:MAG: transcription termination factor NusA [Patescibacteria group bacterium]